MQGAGTKVQAATRRTVRLEQELRSDNVGGSAQAAVAAAGRLGHFVAAGRLAQTGARCEQELRSDNVGGSAEAAVAAAGRLGHGVVAGRLAQVATRRTARCEQEVRSNNVGGNAEAVVAPAGRLGHGVVAQVATRRTARCEQEIRSDNVRGSAETVVAAAGRLGHGVVAGRLAQVANGRTWSHDEENVLIEEYARVGMCRVCIIRRPRAHTCMYVCTIDGAISTHIDTHEHMQSLTCT